MTSALALAEKQTEAVTFPIGELFQPIMADPKEPQFSTAAHLVDSTGRLGHFFAAVVSYGEHFGLRRWQDANGGQWQVSIVGALFAQFNLDAASKDLINADYAIGVSGTHRRGPLSYRLRLLHQSTHLGDELLLSGQAPERINFSLEATDFLAAYTWRDFRIYGGGSYLLDVEPDALDRIGLQFGGEFLGSKKRILRGHLIGGVDLSAFEGDEWRINTAIKAGLEFGKPGSGNRRIRLMLEAFEGHAPFGQFYDVNIKSFGIGVYLLF